MYFELAKNIGRALSLILYWNKIGSIKIGATRNTLSTKYLCGEMSRN